jgi:phospholipid N-methyltransferase
MFYRFFKNLQSKMPPKLNKQHSFRYFILEWLDNPASVGAFCPSSKKLARTMAESVILTEKGYCIELGPGTGVVTQALLDHGIPQERLILIERSARFVKILQKKFPSLTIIQGDATELATLLKTQLGDKVKVDSIVSSLPLRSIPLDIRNAIVTQWQHLLTDKSRVIQFSYFIFGKSATGNKSVYDKISHSVVMRNFPPAKVYCYEKKEENGASNSVQTPSRKGPTTPQHEAA